MGTQRLTTRCTRTTKACKLVPKRRDMNVKQLQRKKQKYCDTTKRRDTQQAEKYTKSLQRDIKQLQRAANIHN